MNSSNCEHLSQDLIFRTLDEELTSAERLECEGHLAACEGCRQQLASVREFSLEVEAAVSAISMPAMENGRRDLEKAIESHNSAAPVLLQHPGKVMRRFGWGMGIAATLALGVLLAPKLDWGPQSSVVEPTNRAVSATPQAVQAVIEVEGETFTPVPYSNADLPISSPHIVEMQVPISSLTDVGIVLEPVVNRAGLGSDGEGSVLADVLVGADGQPRGVHVLAYE